MTNIYRFETGIRSKDNIALVKKWKYAIPKGESVSFCINVLLPFRNDSSDKSSLPPVAYPKGEQGVRTPTLLKYDP